MKLFECGIRYEKTLENGLQKKVTELYIVDALSFSEAESRIIGEMSCYSSVEFDVVSEKITNYSEVVSTTDAKADKWYKVKINFVALDERTEKEKKTAVYYLIQAKDIDDARRHTDKFMQGCASDWECEAVSETKIMDVFLYAPDALHGKAKTYEDKELKAAAHDGCQRAVKRFIDSIPDGQKVTISATGCDDVVIDKSDGHEKQDDA